MKKVTTTGAGAGAFFGASLAIDGDTVVVGAFGEDAGGSFAGAAYVFQRNNGGAENWGEVKKLTSFDAHADDFFGISVAVSGDTVVVGAHREDAGGSGAGAAYVFQRSEGGAGNWGEVNKLTASDAEAGDFFGHRVAVNGDTALVGAWLEDSGGSSAGAAYLFDLLVPKPTPPPVGGIALDSDVRPLPLETARPGRSPWGFALWIAAAASLAAVSGVGWYARRRATG